MLQCARTGGGRSCKLHHGSSFAQKKSIIYKYVLLVAGCSVILAPTVTGFENKIKQQQNFNEGEEKSKICCHVHHGWFLLVDLWM